jgi:anaerobic ribonucleoside-triphosphate reductase activating protein
MLFKEKPATEKDEVQAIALSRVHFPVTALGPGRRVGIWFQGCSIRCPGCISADTWAPHSPDITVENLLESLDSWLSACDGITISGGEPFDQPDALIKLLKGLREQHYGDILVFTGFEKSEIRSLLERTSGLIDALVTGPYRAVAGQTKALRGSNNQELHLLTDLGRERFESFVDSAPIRNLDMMMGANGEIYFAGIPAPGDFTALKTALQLDGTQFVTTEDQRS